MDEPIPEINVPILEPSKPILKPTSIEHFENKVLKPIKKASKKFTDWILSLTPENIKKTVKKRVESQKERFNRIFKSFIPKEQETALKGYLKTYRIDGQKGYGPKTFINKIKQKVIDLINQKKKSHKVKFILTCKFIKESLLTDHIDETLRYFNSPLEIILEATDLFNLFDSMTNHLLEEFERFIVNGYGWKFSYVEYFDIHIDSFVPLSGSSYIPLPSKLAYKRAIINVRNEKDHECFKWAVTSAVFPREKDPQRLNKQMREKSNNFDWSGIEFPVEWKHIDKFEKKNPYAINVCEYEGDLRPLRLSKKQGCEFINLLLISEDGNKHYCWIKNFSRASSSQFNNHQHAREPCHRCLNSFNSNDSLEKHLEYCNINEVKIDMPKDKDGNPKYIKFNNYNRKMRAPFVVYADFESFPEKIHTCSPDESKSFTKQYQKHKPSGFCYLIKSFDDKIFPPQLVQYTSESPEDDISQIFVDTLEKDIREIYDEIKSNKLKFHKKVEDLSEMDKKDYKNATHCHICEFELGEDKVLDHCHLTGKYRGAAHNKCNLNYEIPKFFPVIFHNLSGYDSHLFIKNLGTSEGNINCIPNNEEKYISFTKQIVVDTFINEEDKQVDVKRDIRFIDSFKFMATSLDKLVDNLTKCGKCDVCRGVLSGSKCLSPTDKNLTETKDYFKDKTNMMLRKGVFPYDWFDGFDKLNETQLPPKEAFYSKLNDEDITEDNYQHAKKVWETFNMKTMREYHDLYL